MTNLYRHQNQTNFLPRIKVDSLTYMPNIIYTTKLMCYVMQNYCNAKKLQYHTFLFQGLDSDGNPTLVLHLRVQFYVDSPLLLRWEISILIFLVILWHSCFWITGTQFLVFTITFNCAWIFLKLSGCVRVRNGCWDCWAALCRRTSATTTCPSKTMVPTSTPLILFLRT